MSFSGEKRTDKIPVFLVFVGFYVAMRFSVVDFTGAVFRLFGQNTVPSVFFYCCTL
jgi:hypothetical protein